MRPCWLCTSHSLQVIITGWWEGMGTRLSEGSIDTICAFLFLWRMQASSSGRGLRLMKLVRSWSCQARSQCLWCVALCGVSWSVRWLMTSSAGLLWTQATRGKGWLMEPTLTTSSIISFPQISSSRSSNSWAFHNPDWITWSVLCPKMWCNISARMLNSCVHGLFSEKTALANWIMQIKFNLSNSTAKVVSLPYSQKVQMSHVLSDISWEWCLLHKECHNYI